MFMGTNLIVYCVWGRQSIYFLPAANKYLIALVMEHIFNKNSLNYPIVVNKLINVVQFYIYMIPINVIVDLITSYKHGIFFKFFLLFNFLFPGFCFVCYKNELLRTLGILK